MKLRCDKNVILKTLSQVNTSVYLRWVGYFLQSYIEPLKVLGFLLDNWSKEVWIINTHILCEF